MSEESRHAVEWAIGTVLRDGDEMLIVNLNGNEAKGACACSCHACRADRRAVDPDAGVTAVDRAQKVGIQSGVRTHAPSSLSPRSRPPAQRSAPAYIVARQSTGLLQPPGAKAHTSGA
jgi:hypothetical protein